MLDFSDPREPEGRLLGSAAISVPDEAVERGGGKSGSVWVTSPLTTAAAANMDHSVQPAKGATFSSTCSGADVSTDEEAK